jgi:AraC-like DNA-binding protein
MSPRNFARVFAREVGTTPGQFVERVPRRGGPPAARGIHDGVDGAACRCGFGTAETMRARSCHAVGAPSRYRTPLPRCDTVH